MNCCNEEEAVVQVVKELVSGLLQVTWSYLRALGKPPLLFLY